MSSKIDYETRKALTAGDIVDLGSDVVNCYTSPKKMADSAVEQFEHMHRTLQSTYFQAFILPIVKHLAKNWRDSTGTEHGELEIARYYDGRNKTICRMADAMLRGYEEFCEEQNGGTEYVPFR